MHIPVLLKETIEILNPKKGEFFIDGTLGGGGHAMAVIENINSGGVFLGIDWDNELLEKFGLEIRNLKLEGKIILINGNYADIPEILEENELPKADGLLIDLGFSSQQLESGKGFSFMKDEPLDMRYNKETGLTAAEVINSFSEVQLADIFWRYGEEKFNRKIAKRIIEERRKNRILTTFELAKIIEKSILFNRGKLNPATKVFQALRICVNDELGNLERLLRNIDKILKKGSRLVIISFHSLEDCLVKKYFRELAKKNKAEILTKKPIKPSKEEIINNPRSRSAKLRAIILN
ncbi:16S rRNA (cytosine(1402)-N(4))-methyltransferase RsmH [Candidatus Wolfebacteria bacterium]|nr:16S rRNA (cytosine(1402)-N(4))-methyltransferase RsmH [Candidatus Wolfebacteria bacterium]